MKRELIKKITFVVMCLTFLAAFTISCTLPDDENNLRHSLKFEMTGNYTGNLKATIIYASLDKSGTETIDVASLPWSKEIEVVGPYELSIGTMTGDKTGNKNEEVTVKMYVDGSAVKSITAIADADGHIFSDIIKFEGEN